MNLLDEKSQMRDIEKIEIVCNTKIVALYAIFDEVHFSRISLHRQFDMLFDVRVRSTFCRFIKIHRFLLYS